MGIISMKYLEDDPNSITFVKQIELSSLGIKNDGTSPLETSTGLNQALQVAKEQGCNKIIFPKGTYLIHENNPIIIDLKNTVIDLNGSTFQININQAEYSIIEIRAIAENVKIINGNIIGNITIAN